MSWGFVALGGATLVSGIMGKKSADTAADASRAAGDAQAAAVELGIEENRRQFDAITALLKPYTEAGPGALTGIEDLLGLNGPGAQRTAIAGIESSPEMSALTQQGEEAILANASATGGLRGGDTQGALAQFRPAMLSQLINERFSRLGGLVQVGQAAAAGQAAAGQAQGQVVGGLLQQQGAAQAGGILGAGQARAQGQAALGANIGSSLGTLGTLRLLKKF